MIYHDFTRILLFYLQIFHNHSRHMMLRDLPVIPHFLPLIPRMAMGQILHHCLKLNVYQLMPQNKTHLLCPKSSGYISQQIPVYPSNFHSIHVLMPRKCGHRMYLLFCRVPVTLKEVQKASQTRSWDQTTVGIRHLGSSPFPFPSPLIALPLFSHLPQQHPGHTRASPWPLVPSTVAASVPCCASP